MFKEIRNSSAVVNRSKIRSLEPCSKKTTWLRLLLTKLDLLRISKQYVEIKLTKESSETKQILADIRDQEKETVPLRAQHSEFERIASIKKVCLLRQPLLVIILHFPLIIFHFL